jgi:hypothetical protein
VALNTRALAARFVTAVNYYSDAEENDAGHQFATSGTTIDYIEKTRLAKDGRGLLANTSIEPEDCPAAGSCSWRPSASIGRRASAHRRTLSRSGAGCIQPSHEFPHALGDADN